MFTNNIGITLATVAIMLTVAATATACNPYSANTDELTYVHYTETAVNSMNIEGISYAIGECDKIGATDFSQIKDIIAADAISNLEEASGVEGIVLEHEQLTHSTSVGDTLIQHTEGYIGGYRFEGAYGFTPRRKPLYIIAFDDEGSDLSLDDDMVEQFLHDYANSEARHVSIHIGE